MKKPLILMSVLLFLIASAVHAQVTQTNTQFPNPGFEKWVKHPSASTNAGTNAQWVPFNWHTFDEAGCGLSLGCSTARKNHHHSMNVLQDDVYNNTSVQYTGGSDNNTKYIGIICKYVNFIIADAYANGALSTGKTYVGDSHPTYPANYNYTDISNSSSYSTSGKFSWSFVGCPDSMSFWYKTSMQNAAVKPLFKVYLHENGEFRDRANGTLYGNSTTRLIGSSVDTFSQSSTWKREAHPFSYSHPGTETGNAFTFLGQNSATHPIYGYYTTLNQPAFMLASFSTDKTAGEENQSNNDALYVDELWCIYDKGLSSVAIGGTANSAALNTFNAAEYATHEPTRTYDANGNPSFNNSGSATWTYRIAIPCNNIPQVTATPKSKLVSEFTITQATAANGYKAHIYVKHNDNSTFDYYIQFTPALPTVTLNNGGTYTACEGDSITVTASGASTYSWSNELGSGATVHPTASGSYTVTGTASNGCTNTATATVTVNARPSVNITGPSSLCQGTTGTLTATGSFISCTWDDNSTNTTRNITPMNAGTATYSVTVTGSNSCTNSTSTTVNVMANPSITTVSANTPCTGDDLILNVETETESAIFAWSGPNDFASNEQNPTIGNASTIMNGDYTVTVTDQTTECSASDTVTVTVNPRPSVNITGPSSLCQGTTGTLTATGSFVSCTWDDDSTNATRDITPMNAGPATYSVTVTDSNSCTNTTSTTVNVMANPNITTVSANTPCTGYDLILNAETETEGAIFAWSGPNDFTSNEQNPTIGNASTTMNGDYTVTVTDTATECSAAASVTVTVNQPTTNDTTATACESFDWYNHSNITESCSNLTHTLAGANING